MFNLNPNPNPDHFEIINDIQESFREKQIRYVIFHDGINYTVTPTLERAFATNKPFYAVSYYNVHYLGVVPKEKQEEVRVYFEKVSAVEKDERSIYEAATPKPNLEEEYNPFMEIPFDEPTLEEKYNPFANIPYEAEVDEKYVMSLFDKKEEKPKSVIEKPNLVEDIFLLVGHELGYYTKELDEMLQYLGRMQPVYQEFLNLERVEVPDFHKLQFYFDKVLRKFNKTTEEIVLFVDVVSEKLLETDDVIRGKVDKLLVELFVSEMIK